MSMRPRAWPEVPEETARVAKVLQFCENLTDRQAAAGWPA